jgi:16S rRNA (cytidine1402-2'-O)-methyltransferase
VSAQVRPGRNRGSGTARRGGCALVLVGTPIGNLADLSPRAAEALRDADIIAAEDTRRTRALLAHAGVSAGRRLRSVRAQNEARLAEHVVGEIRNGARVAYVTDAGMPGVSDPGTRLVRAVLDAGLPVDVVPGPSALLSALVVSGLPTARFAFEGFLPRKGTSRRERLAAIAMEDRTVVLFEAPARVPTTLADLVEACGRHRPVAVARELTKRFEAVWRGTLGDAVRHVARHQPRGEHVLVIGPVDRSAREVDERAVEDAVAAALDGGLSARDAATRAAGVLDIPKRRAYEVATRLARARRET